MNIGAPISSLLFRLGFVAVLAASSLTGAVGADLKYGVAEVNISPPVDYPLMGWHLGRTVAGCKDPLKARILYLSDGKGEVALVFCDLGGISIDLSTEVRKRAGAKTGLKPSHIILMATQCHGAPDYSMELWEVLDPEGSKPDLNRKYPPYVNELMDKVTSGINEAKSKAFPCQLKAGRTTQKTPVSFSKRMVMRDGSVKTGVTIKEPGAVKPGGPADPEVGLLHVLPENGNAPQALLTNFALHACTWDGPECSADFPVFLESSLRKTLGDNAVSLFGVGCCADLGHMDPITGKDQDAATIGNALGSTIKDALSSLTPVKDVTIQMKTKTLALPIIEAKPVDILGANQVMWKLRIGEKVDEEEKMRSYRLVMLDQFLYTRSYVEGHKHLKWGLSRTWKGVGESFPAQIHLLTIGPDVAIFFLPGEVFSELGMEIKNGSPFANTMVIQMAHAAETAIIPTRAAYAQGGKEITESLIRPGTGERLVESALGLARDAAREILDREKAKGR